MTTYLRKRDHKPKLEGPWMPKAEHSTGAYVCVGPEDWVCRIWHRTEGAAKRHCEKLNRKENKSA